MIFTITVLWYHWVIALFVVGVIGFYGIAGRARDYDLGTPMLALLFTAICWCLAIGILIGNCGR